MGCFQKRPHPEIEMILVFTGEGKGKSSAAIGTIIRSLGWGKKVTLVRFFKGWWKTGEEIFLKGIANSNKAFVMKSFPVSEWVKEPTAEVKELCEEAFIFSKKSINEKPFLVVLDEILLVVNMGLVKEKALLQLINLANKHSVNLILTGRGFPKSAKKSVDLISNITAVKHPYTRGKKGVKGIDW